MADIDVGAITEALNDKADIDLGNANKELLLFVGMVAPFAGTSAPAGWLKCDGSAISRTTYSALFDVIGTTYGSGDGSTTFNLPKQSVLPLGTSVSITGQAYGNGNTLGLTDGSSTGVLRDWGEHAIPTPGYTNTKLPATATGSWSGTENKLLGLATNPSQSGIVVSGTADLTKATGAKAIVCIKY